jgi:dienelactone hydrolase
VTIIRFNHEGTELAGELTLPEASEQQALIMVMHTGLGIGDHVRGVAERLGALGYATLLTDMFGEGVHGDFAKAAPAFAAMQADRALIRRRARVWYDCALGVEGVDPARIAALGYCFGGQCVLELARSGADLRAAVSFHGLLTTLAPAMPGAIKGQLVAWCGGADPYAPTADIDALRAEMDAAGARHQLSVFAGVPHGFTDPNPMVPGREGIAYDAIADAVSWAGTVALLDTVLKKG